MDVSRLDRGLQIAGAGGLVLLISLFLPWYGASASIGSISASDNASAWQAFSFVDILLFLIAVIAIAAAVMTAMGNVPAALPVPIGQLLLGAGALAVLLIVFRLLDLPGPGGDISGVDVDVSRKLGIFVGLISAGAIVFGAMQVKGEPYQPPVR